MSEPIIWEISIVTIKPLEDPISMEIGINQQDWNGSVEELNWEDCILDHRIVISLILEPNPPEQKFRPILKHCIWNDHKYWHQKTNKLQPCNVMKVLWTELCWVLLLLENVIIGCFLCIGLSFLFDQLITETLHVQCAHFICSHIVLLDVMVLNKRILLDHVPIWICIWENVSTISCWPCVFESIWVFQDKEE